MLWTLPHPEEILDFMELTAAFTAADPPCIAWLIPAQLWLTAVCTPAIAWVIAVESVVDRLFAAVSTRPTLLLMPSASPCMKSGIQLSKSARGPSSGTEKCRKERILSATLVTAEATLPIQDLIPFTIPLIISAPQENACPASPLIKDTALLKPVLMVEVIPLIVVETADFTLFQMVVTPVRMPFIAVDTADFAALNPVVTTDLMPLTTVLTADLMPFQTVVTTDLMPFITVVITLFIPFHTVDTTAWIAFRTVVTVPLMAFHAVDTTDWMADSTVVTTVLIVFHTVVTAVWMALSTVVITV